MTELIEPRENAPAVASGPAKTLLLQSLGLGVLAGLAEMCWSYLLPVIGADWRAVLPVTPGGLAAFGLAAIVTDTVIMLLGAAIVLVGVVVLSGLKRYSGWSDRSKLIASTLMLGGMLSYLYAGWIVLFVLLSGQRHTLEYRLILFGGIAALLLGAWVTNLAIRSATRRWKQVKSIKIWGVCVLVLLGVLGPGFLRYRNTRPAAAAIERVVQTPPFNVLLVTLDTLRVDYLGAYGNPWIDTPTLDELAVDSIVFDSAISQAPSTAPSHCSIMTSLYPFDHEAENGKPMARGLTTLADILRANGCETIAFTSSTTTRSVNSGLQQGFDRYVDSLVPWSELFGRDEFQQLILFYLVGILENSQISGEVVSDRALRWLNRHGQQPFFAWLHYFDPHDPYGSPPPFRGKYKGKLADGLPMAEQRERYAEDITFADFQLGRVIAALKAKGLYDQTLIVVAADHGEAFGELHGDVTEKLHGRYLYDTTQHVPLIIKPAGARLLGRRVAEQVELTDIAPTVLELIGIAAPDTFRGKSLAALLDDRPFPYAGRDAHSFNVIDVTLPGAAAHDVSFVQQLALRSPEWKFITRPRMAAEELYSLSRDPHERTNLAGEFSDVADERRAIISPFWNAHRDASEDPRQRLAPTLIRELKALGYIGGDDEAGEDE